MSHTGATVRSLRDLELTDAMSSDLRRCVHEYGFEIVRACLHVGVEKPHQIRNLVREIWRGARQPFQRKHESGNSSAMNQLDWILMQSGSQVGAAGLVRFLYQMGFVVVPLEPTPQMVEASIDITDTLGKVTKFQKHKRRLRAAHQKALQVFWPAVDGEGSER